MSCKLQLYDQNELLSIYSSLGFKLKSKKGLSIFHQIVRILYVKGEISENELASNIQSLRKAFDYLDKNGIFNKTHLFHHLK